MTTRMRSHSRGLRMPLLALTASASIVGGVFIAAQPAYSANEVVGATGQCVTAADEGASIIVSSVVPSGAPLHVEGAGWVPALRRLAVLLSSRSTMGRKSDPMVSPFPLGFPRLFSVIRLRGALPKCRRPANSPPISSCRRPGRSARSIRS